MDLERFRWMDVGWMRFSTLKRMSDGSFQHSEWPGLELVQALCFLVYSGLRDEKKFFMQRKYRNPVLLVRKSRDLCRHIARNQQRG